MKTSVRIGVFLTAIALGAIAYRVASTMRGPTQPRPIPRALPAPLSGEPDSTHSHAHAPVPGNLTQAVTLLRRYQREIDRSLVAGTMTGVSDSASAIAQIAPEIGALSLDAASGVARAQVRDANLLGKQLAADAEALHLAVDAPGATAAAVAPRFQPVSAAIDKLETLAPPRWACDMHCEPGKVYDAQGKCPVCRMALTKVADLPFGLAVSTELGGGGGVQPGKPVKVTLRLLDQIGLPVRDLDIVHEQPLHLLGVSADLSWYMHEHPVRNDSGDFELTQTFPHGGPFTLFADFTPTGYGQQVPQARIVVAGDPPPPVALVEDIEDVHTVDGYEFRLRCNGQRFFAGADSLLRFGISKDGQTVTNLEPYLGAMGHLVIISQDLKDFVHSHPLDGDHAHGGAGGHDHAKMLAESRRDPATQSTPSDAAHLQHAEALGNGTPHDVTFHAVFPRPGLYRAFGQFMHRGRVLTVPFTIDAQPLPPPASPPSPPSPTSPASPAPSPHTRSR